MGVRDVALAGLAEDVGQALLRYATRLRDASADPDPVRGSEPSTPAPAGSPNAVSVPARDDPGRRRLGASQRRVLEAVEAAGVTGTTAKEVAAVTGLKSTNTPRMLKSLAERGLVASWGSNPVIWYARN